MQVTDVKFYDLADPMWVSRMEVQGVDFVHRAAFVVAQVGDVPVEAIVVKMNGDGFVGHLRTLPPVGAELKVGYADTPLMGTGFTYPPSV